MASFDFSVSKCALSSTRIALTFFWSTQTCTAPPYARLAHDALLCPIGDLPYSTRSRTAASTRATRWTAGARRLGARREETAMILVTGATGHVGGELVRRLTAAGHPVRAMTRRPAEARLPAGVEAVYGDADDPASLDAAFA